MPTFKEYIGKKSIPRGFWKKDNVLNIDNIRLWVKWFEIEHKIANYDWYKITGAQINKDGGSGFFTSKAINQLNESVVKLMRFVYPEIMWKEWKFTQTPQGWWQSDMNIIRWWNEEIVPSENIVVPNNCYKIKLEDLTKYPGSGWKDRCGDSIIGLLKVVYPKEVWIEWKFAQVPKGFWCDMATDTLNRENISRWFDIEIKQKGYPTYEDMYNLTQNILNDSYGNGLLMHYFRGSPLDLLKYLYPDVHWQFWKFVSAPNGAWDDLKNQQMFLKEEIVNDRDLSVLYHSTSQLPSGLLSKYKSPFELVRTCFPDYSWNESEFIGYEAERRVFNLIQLKYPTAETKFRPSWCINPETGRGLEYDCYIPELQTIFEIDGRQHFEQVWIMKTNIERDIYKMVCARNKGIRTVRIFQEDIASHSDEWLEKVLLDVLMDGKHEPVYLSFKDVHLYDKHARLYLESISAQTQTPPTSYLSA